jgi:Secretion system C-terminal sorting domain
MIKKILPTIMALALMVTTLNAQINYTFSASTGTYTALTTPTQVTLAACVTGNPATDDGYKNNITIPFSFNFNGTAYTKVHVCSNGFLAFGTALVTTAATPSPVYYSQGDLPGSFATDTLARPIIAPFWTDLDVQTNALGGGISYKTLGTTPNRTFVVQFKNVLWDYGATAGCLSYQAILHETSNVIDFIYQQEAGATVSSYANSLDAVIGIAAKKRGAVSFMSLQDVSATPVVSKVTQGHILDQRPATGQMYTFTPMPANYNDVALANFYTPSTIATYGDAQSMGTFVANNGNTTLTNLPVYLDVTGANTFKDTFVIASIAPGASGSLTFKSFKSTNVGNNNISITTGADADNTNNTVSADQQVTTNTIDYTTAAPSYGGLGQKGTGKYWEMATKISNPTAHAVSNILLNFETGGQPVTVSIYDATGTGGTPGTQLWASAAPVTTTAGAMSVPVSPAFSVTGDYFVAVNQEDTFSMDYSYEYEYPVRAGKFYFNSTIGTPSFYDARNTGAAYFKLKMGVQHEVVVTPVKLTSFTGVRLENKTNKISWETATEVNNKGFELQKSIDGKSFEKLNFINSKSTNSSTVQNYNFIDATPFAAKTYYRLKQIDNNGTFSFSSIIAVKSSIIKNVEISAVYPNPAQEKINVTVATPTSQKVNVVVTDLLGKIVAQQAMVTVVGETTTHINVSSLAKGNYNVKVICDNGCETAAQKFVKM